MCGGYKDGLVLSLAVNTNLLCNIMVKGSKAERENLFEISCRFLENRIGNGLKLDHKSYSLIRGKDYVGDLESIQRSFKPAKNHDEVILKTNSTHDLLDILKNGNNEPHTKLVRSQPKPKVWIEEMDENGDEFGNNLRQRFMKQKPQTKSKQVSILMPFLDPKEMMSTKICQRSKSSRFLIGWGLSKAKNNDLIGMQLWFYLPDFNHESETLLFYLDKVRML